MAFSVTTRVPVDNVDAGGAGTGVALPDGGAVLVAADAARAVLVQLNARGSLDPAFGIARPALADTARVVQVLRRPDGRLLLVRANYGGPPAGSPRLEVVGLTAAGALDPSFGRAGVTTTGVEEVCGGCHPAALASDGSLLLTGAVTTRAEVFVHRPAVPTPPDRRWVVARLTPTGAPDPSFGAGGTVTLAAGADRAAGGLGVGTTSAGRILVFGRSAPGLQLRALTSAGEVDPTYHDGLPVSVPFAFGARSDVRSDGGVDVVTPRTLVRFTPSGERDTAFGATGVVAIPEIPGGFTPSTLATSDGGVLVSSTASYDGRVAGLPDVRLVRFDQEGRVAASASPALGFGGGAASRLGHTQLFVGGPGQSDFTATDLLARPGGGALVVGGLGLVRPTGEGTGYSTGFVAAAALTDRLDEDRSYGGAARPARVDLTVFAQRARSTAALKRVLVRARVSTAGLLLLRVRDRRGRVLAQSVEPVYRRGTITARVPLTPLGRSLLRRAGPTGIVAGYAFRDVVAGVAAGVVASHLR